MSTRWSTFASITLLGTGLLAASAFAQTSTITHGRITAVRQVDLQNQGAQTTGAVVGGLLGVASGSGQSSSNRALRGLGGAAVGGRVAGAAGSSTGFEYTILIDTRIPSAWSPRRVVCGPATASRWSGASSTIFASLRMRAAPLPRRQPRGLPLARPMPAPLPHSRCWPPRPTPSSTWPSAACGCCATSRNSTKESIE